MDSEQRDRQVRQQIWRQAFERGQHVRIPIWTQIEHQTNDAVMCRVLTVVWLIQPLLVGGQAKEDYDEQ